MSAVANPAVNAFLRQVQIEASENNAGGNVITEFIGDINNHSSVKRAIQGLASGEELSKNAHAILTGGSERLNHVVTGVQAVVAGLSHEDAMHLYNSIQKGGSAKEWLSSRLNNLEGLTQQKIASYRELAKVVSTTVPPTGLGRVGAAVTYNSVRSKVKNPIFNTGKVINQFLTGGKQNNRFGKDKDLKRRIKIARETGDTEMLKALKKERYALLQQSLGGGKVRGYRPEGNFPQRIAGRAQAYSPFNFLRGTGLAHVRTLEHSSGFEAAIGRTAGRVMDNSVFRGAQNVLSAPKRVRENIQKILRLDVIDHKVTVPLKKGKKLLKKRLERLAGKSIAKLGTKIAVKEGAIAVIGAATGGVGWVIGAGYETLNFITGGALDNIIGGALKLLIRILVITIVAGILLFCALLFALFNNSYFSYFLPNKFKLPRPVAVAGLNAEQKLQQLKVPGENSCPWQGGTCTQGPYGCVGLDLATHYKENASGKRESFTGAIDVGLSAGSKLRAPESGTVLDLGALQCGDGNIAGGQFTLNGDSGATYNFLHANATTSGHVEKNDIIGEISNFTPSACMTGAHLHTNVTSADGKIVNAEDFFNTNSCNIDCSVACTVPDNIVPL